jgi:hypothetical protein
MQCHPATEGYPTSHPLGFPYTTQQYPNQGYNYPWYNIPQQSSGDTSATAADATATEGIGQQIIDGVQAHPYLAAGAAAALLYFWNKHNKKGRA